MQYQQLPDVVLDVVICSLTQTISLFMMSHKMKAKCFDLYYLMAHNISFIFFKIFHPCFCEHIITLIKLSSNPTNTAAKWL